MDVRLTNEELPAVSRQAALDHLERVLLSSSFANAERSRRLLRFLVEETVNGRADLLKEYTLATQALGRSLAFDPRHDAIVRAEASRLRDRLSRYYASEGQTDRLIISVPKGSYVPRFENRPASAASVQIGGQTPKGSTRLAWFAISFTTMACLMAALLIGDVRDAGPRPEFSLPGDVAPSLRNNVGPQLGGNLAKSRSIDPESYDLYLRSKALWEARGVTPATQDRNLLEAAMLLERVVTRNPLYAPAWAFLSGTYYGLASNSTDKSDLEDARELANEFRIKGEAAALKAVELDANLDVAYDALGVFAWSRAHVLEAERYFQRGLAFDTDEPNLLGAYAMRLGSVGRLKEALSLVERAYRANPFYPNLAREAAQDRWLNGETASAIALAKTLRSRDRASLLTLIYASMRRYSDAADALMELAEDDHDTEIAKAARLLRAAPQHLPSPETLPNLPPRLSMLYLYLGAPERVLEAYDRLMEVGFLYGSQSPVWHPDFAPVRKTQHFKALMKKAGFVDYWHATGWPQQCHPVTDGDFACD